MGLPRILPLFVLPRLPRSAWVLGPLGSWRDGLAQAGIDLTDGKPDLVVAPASYAREAMAASPPSLVLEGRAGRGALPGYASETFLALPGLDEPEVLVPAGRAAPVTYALSGRRGMRARVARPLLARGVIPPPGRPTVVASREPGPPALVAAAATLLSAPVDSWLPVLGRWGDPFSRGVLLLFEPRAGRPSWALKFSRVPGNERPFDLDERGLSLAAAAGGRVAAHAPRLLGRFTVQGLQASLETATPGTRLLPYLTGPAPRADKLAAVARVAGWIEAVARETRGPESAVDAELARLGGEVVPRWPGPADLADRLRGVPSVVEHGDLWPDNVVIDGASFGLLDWEGARLAGMPLWDLFYFLTAALALVDGTESEEEHFTRLFRGELPSSAFLFEWTRRVAAASGVADDAVPVLATLRLLALTEIDLEHGERIAAVGAAGGVPLSVRLAERWLVDPSLGPGWDRWRA